MPELSLTWGLEEVRCSRPSARAIRGSRWQLKRGLQTCRWPPDGCRPGGRQWYTHRARISPLHRKASILVLNSHEDLSPPDVARVLRPGGRVLTQQVGRNEWQQIAQFFPRTSKEGRPDRFHTYQAGFEGAGLTVIFARSHDTPVSYSSLGDVVYMFAAVMPQWRSHEFDLERDLDALLALERDLSGEKSIVLTESRFVIEAVKRP